MKKRPSKPDDQEKAEEAFQIIQKAIKDNPQIENTLWASAFWSSLTECYQRTGYSYKQYCQLIDEIKLHYQHWWDTPND